MDAEIRFWIGEILGRIVESIDELIADLAEESAGEFEFEEQIGPDGGKSFDYGAKVIDLELGQVLGVEAHRSGFKGLSADVTGGGDRIVFMEEGRVCLQHGGKLSIQEGVTSCQKGGGIEGVADVEL